MSDGKSGARLVRYGPAALVAVGAAVATAHGLYEVAAAAKVPGPIAWLYPLVTDGLAMVAYSATGRLVGKAAGYAWACVIVAAGLSGLAQAVYLAADTVQADPVVRFGVGAWPAVACALVAHLLHLIVTADGDPLVERVGHGGRDLPGEAAPTADDPGQDRVPSPVIEAVPPAAAVAGGAGPGQRPDPQPEPGLVPADEDDGQDDEAREHAKDGEAESGGDARVRLLVELLTAGADVTGPQAAAVLSHQAGAPVSDRTARRLLAAARQATTTTPAATATATGLGGGLPAPPGPAPRVHLHLLPTGTGLSTTDISTQSREGDL